ncbi:MAG: hypothetical protein ACI86X_001055 [Moritella sp.]|jgi:hypothetical protein
MSTYMHKTDRRLRVRSDFIKQNHKSVVALISELEQIDAIQNIKYKRHAGSVAINFDNKEIDCESLLEILDSHGWLQSSIKQAFIESAVTKGTKTFTKGIAMMALRRLVGPSFSRMLSVL